MRNELRKEMERRLINVLCMAPGMLMLDPQVINNNKEN
jgi:hypothetical protein